MVEITALQLMFQGGFVGKTCQLFVMTEEGKMVETMAFYPEDINPLQICIHFLECLTIISSNSDQDVVVNLLLGLSILRHLPTLLIITPFMCQKPRDRQHQGSRSSLNRVPTFLDGSPSINWISLDTMCLQRTIQHRIQHSQSWRWFQPHEIDIEHVQKADTRLKNKQTRFMPVLTTMAI